MAIRSLLRGANEMRAVLRGLAKNYPDRVAAAIYKEAQIEMTEAKKRTPVDTTDNPPHPGQLRRSGFVSQPVREGRNISATLSFGNELTMMDNGVGYEVYVHENPDAIHPVGQWKYLDSVLNESRSSMAGRIAARVQLGKK